MPKEKITGYCTTTYRLRLYINNVEYLQKTQDIYNQGILAYYNLLFDNLEFLNLSNQYCLRELEKLTIINREGVKPKHYIELDMPVYLRRAAINQAIGAVRSYISRLARYEKQGDILQNEPSRTKEFNSKLVFYKGMYKELSTSSVMLKLWNGEKWDWYKGKLKGRNFNSNLETLSPTLVIHSNYIMFHVPVKQVVEDVTPVKERMQNEQLRVCAISFSNYNNFAICVVLDGKGNSIKSNFIKGGNEYKDKVSRITSEIKKHRQINTKLTVKDHKKYWDKLGRIDDYTSQKVSKQIIDFCLENNVQVITISKVEDDIANFQKRVGKHSPIYLRRKIINKLEYKAFKNGMLITTVRQNYTASKCYKCRTKVKRRGDTYICENNHTGNYYFNTAMNIGRMCLKKFGKEINPS